MAQDFGILISQPGTATQGAQANQVLMNTTNPFLKLDTQTTTSFQSLLLLITHNPPEPASGGTNYTMVAKFKHGYKYIPALETLFYVSGPGAATANVQTYFQDSGQLSAHTFDDYAFLYASADATWVYFIVEKYLGSFGPGSPNDLTGTNVQITVHTFVEDVGIP